MDNFLWWRDGVIYQIYPRSFMDSNADGIGDLPGIIHQLDYVQSLGVDAIWLSPIYPSPDVDFGYDVSDYCAIDPKFGNMQDFEELLDQAHKRNLRLILDLVLNHTSDQHPWFQESRKSKDNPYRDYYIWKDPKQDGSFPNNWLAIVGGSCWQLDPQTGQYYFHHYFKEQPDLNWRNPAVRKEMLNVFKFWLDKGVDGFRLDVFSAYFKDANFTDNPKKWFGIRPYDRLEHIYDTDRPEMFPLLKEIRALLDRYPQRYAVGETYLPTIEKAAQYCGDDLLHAAFSFEFLECRWRAKSFLKIIKRWEKATAGKCWPNYVLNNHDVIRSASRYGRGENDDRLKVALVMLLTLRGTPFLYDGEEIGLRDIKLKKSEILDPVGHHYWPLYKGRDGCRAPMQWDDSLNAGFSTARPWLPVNPDYGVRNVQAQEKDDRSLLSLYKKMLRIRKEHIALMRGDFEVGTKYPANTLVYFRCTADEQIMVALNFGSRRKQIDLNALCADGCELLLSSHPLTETRLMDGKYLLQGNEAAIFLLKKI
ncbi:MAG: alpha-glucosidase [Pelolinea sp.]|jgi:alpha-glucosidase|nr:alpha-glucosidase [Pelolinea sp.]